MERTALVLSGGGLRGGAHIGVLKVFERVGLLQQVQVVAGTSAGAIAGTMLASGASLEAIEQAVIALRTTPCDQLFDFNGDGLRAAACASDFGLFSGFIGGDAVVELVQKNLVYLQRFSDYATLPPDVQDKVRDLLLVSVNLDTGTKTVFCDPARYTSYDEGIVCGQISLAQAARASSSEPAVVVPFRCPGGESCTCGRPLPGAGSTPQSFVDGAVRDNCPLKLAVQLAGCTRVLAVSLGYAGDRVVGVATQGLAEIINQSITIMGSQQLDADVDYLRTQVKDGDLKLSAYILNPRLYDMGTFDFDRLPEAIQRGELAAEWFLTEADKQLHIYKPDGTVDPERLFGQQGVFSYNYPDPEREARRQQLMQVDRARVQAARPCHIEQELARLALLTAGAIVSMSLALFTVGGVVALRLKPNAASAADVFVFWDGGLVLFLLGWIIFLILLRLWLCRPKAQTT